jgi:hypothetical protein
MISFYTDLRREIGCSVKKIVKFASRLGSNIGRYTRRNFLAVLGNYKEFVTCLLSRAMGSDQPEIRGISEHLKRVPEDLDQHWLGSRRTSASSTGVRKRDSRSRGRAL